MRYLIIATAFALLSVGCSEKKDEPQDQQTGISKEQTPAKELTKAKKYKIPLDSSQIVTLENFDPNDSIMVGIRAFRAAEKEFVKLWKYTKDTELFIDIVGKICRENRPCASRLDSIAYKNDVAFILDSLMRNNLLEKNIEARKQEIIEWKRSCHAQVVPSKECHEKLNKEMKEKVMKEIKKRRENKE